MVDLILEAVATSEAEMRGRTDTVNDEKNTLTGGRPTVLVVVPTEFLKVDTLSVNHNTHIVIIPPIDLVEIELEQDKVCVLRDTGVCLLCWLALGGYIVSTEELGKRR